ncbi:MAG TPA: PTS sugar transporter subunit IIA [Candidatus Ratteibacteria bacterium]|jgi:PTS system nitrogen regulatory IIA component|uniref:PTS system fructose-specific EIIABC component n=1 Tax=candidate division TA06 bacterium ADurb.Bin131 TaxID=1852827 RepID=A0A1V6CDX5_UNCT6|nr:MAG: PTS system fructose-specific EIIABC component [candidate division TA06 bacterium ADurb.Bin131]HOC01862.1 PTS sugar transporter subunit IIA [bacterium]HRS06030.1 PTS sugar transporter subunit IIA [Candidatus Ratteibacteria bacterium]HON04952.1 PTS sugar transporter subunit IIA [bacterium]HOQ81477.1 PTS sugar transporter subunit IIA [bacterium]
MKISEFISEKEIIIGMKATEKQAALDELLQVLEKNNLIQDRKQVLDILLEREKLGSTGIGQGIAVPHAKTDQVKNLVCALGTSEKGINFDSLDGEPVYIIFLVLAPSGATGIHLKALAKIARLLKDKVFRNYLRMSKTPEEAYQIIKEDEDRLNNIG